MATNYLSLSKFSPSNFVELFIVLALTLICIFIVLPSVILFLEDRKSKIDKKHKKKLLAQILVQKEIEDEIEKSVQIEEERKVT